MAWFGVRRRGPIGPRSSLVRLVPALAVAILLTALAGACSSSSSSSSTSTSQSPASTAGSATASSGAPAGALQLDSSKNYGDRYANGIVPVGDGHYVTSGPKAGYVYACSQYATNLKTDNGGAQVRGPWFVDGDTAYDLTKKLHVEGHVMWTADFSNTLSGDTRTIVTNDLPSHPTGVFPIQSSDPAYQYDRNPNSIKGQTYTFTLTADPQYGTPQCMQGEVGIMLTGVVLLSGFDAGGRDAGAWEIQDGCDGHPQQNGVYHYHTLSSCITDANVTDVIGYALDGFPITGPTIAKGNVLSTADLDECHGIVSPITFNGKQVTMYHYVMTEDFPYSVSCFRGTPTQPPGLGGGQGDGSGNQSSGGPPGGPGGTGPQ